jgi:hypothetical protein
VLRLGWRAADYQRAGVRSRAQAWQQAGIPATLAGRFTSLSIPVSTAQTLAGTFSQKHLRALLDPARNFRSSDVNSLTQFTGDGASVGRAWLNTGFQWRHILALHAWGIRPSVAWAWQQRLSVFQQRVLLTDVLEVATVVYRVPTEDLNGWIAYANDHDIPYQSYGNAWSFLGGHTALLARAGVSPTEAETMTQAGTLDLPRLLTLAGLRGGSA